MAEREMKRLVTDKADADKTFADLKDKFAKHKKFADDKIRALAKAESDVRALEGRLEDATRELRDAKGSGDSENAEVAELRAKTAAQAKDLAAKAKELVKAREETRRMERYRTECDELKTRLAEARDANDKAQKELIRARAKAAGTPQASPARSSTTNRSGNTSGKSSATSTPAPDAEELRQPTPAATTPEDDATIRVPVKETAETTVSPTVPIPADVADPGALDAARAEAAEKDRLAKSLEAKLRALEISSESALAATNSSKETIAELTSALAASRAQCAAEKTRAATLESELATKESEREALTARLSESMKPLKENANEKADETADEIDELRARLRASDEQLAKARADAATADAALERYKSETHAELARRASEFAEERAR